MPDEITIVGALVVQSVEHAHGQPRFEVGNLPGEVVSLTGGLHCPTASMVDRPGPASCEKVKAGRVLNGRTGFGSARRR